MKEHGRSEPVPTGYSKQPTAIPWWHVALILAVVIGIPLGVMWIDGKGAAVAGITLMPLMVALWVTVTVLFFTAVWSFFRGKLGKGFALFGLCVALALLNLVVVMPALKAVATT